MASLLRGLQDSFRRLGAHAQSRLHGGTVVETLGTIRGGVKGLCLDCQPTDEIVVHRLDGEAGASSARVALAFGQKVHFGRGDSAIVVSLTEPEVRTLIEMLRRVCPDDGA